MLRFLATILPVALHCVLFLATSPPWSQVEWTRLDKAVPVLIAGYLALGLLLFRAPRFQARYLLFTYSALGTLAITECVLCFIIPFPKPKVPWPPVSRAAIASDTMPGIEGPINFSVNSLGIRGPEEASFAKAAIRILCVGGSTTECLYVSDKQSWPWRLQDILTDRHGEAVYVGNAGHSGHFTLHHSYQIRNYDLVQNFDHVVVLCGINDMLRFLNKSYSRSQQRVPVEALVPDASSLVYYRRLRWCPIVRAFYWRHVNPIGLEQDRNGARVADARQARQDVIRNGTIPQLPDNLGEAVARYRRDLLDLIDACQERGVRPVFLTQPTMYKDKLSPELDSLLWISHLRPGTLERVIEVYNSELRGVCRDEDVHCIDLATMLPKDTTVFYDDCHFNVPGCEKVALIVADSFEYDLKIHQGALRNAYRHRDYVR